MSFSRRVSPRANLADHHHRYGPWKTVYHRFSQWEQDGTWACIERRLQADAAAAGDLGWRAQADATNVRAHQNAAGARKKG
jgi:transposase